MWEIFVFPDTPSTPIPWPFATPSNSYAAYSSNQKEENSKM
jgi:hypothetical protein